MNTEGEKMYYTFYMNERMALDNWNYYDDCNWLLRNLVIKDNRKDFKEKIDFYLEHRHERDENEIEWLKDDEEFQSAYNDYLDKKMMYESWIEGDTDGRCYVDFRKNRYFENYRKMTEYQDEGLYTKFENMIHRNERVGCKLREVNEVVIYKSDLDYIENARKQYHLTVRQTELLFGLIFFSRMNNCKWCRIGTTFKWKSFRSCFDKTIKRRRYL